VDNSLETNDPKHNDKTMYTFPGGQRDLHDDDRQHRKSLEKNNFKLKNIKFIPETFFVAKSG